MGRGLQAETASETVQRTAAREAFFLDFAKETRRRFPGLILMLTGGFRSRQGIQAALKGGACDIVGIGRPAVVCPNFPELIMDDKYTDEEAKVILGKVPTPLWARIFQIRVLGGGAETVCHMSDSCPDELLHRHFLTICSNFTLGRLNVWLLGMLLMHLNGGTYFSYYWDLEIGNGTSVYNLPMLCRLFTGTVLLAYYLLACSYRFIKYLFLYGIG